MNECKKRMKYKEWRQIKKENKNDGRIKWNVGNLRMNKKCMNEWMKKSKRIRLKGKLLKRKLWK